ncbi:hypothetical protein [Solicola sp. PLA-1-18]|uniref:hypothetical protein n=1 Tax=Solicola sp. PLA-1-18 TaxID=3380532 RepID=UPI003B7D0398
MTLTPARLSQVTVLVAERRTELFAGTRSAADARALASMLDLAWVAGLLDDLDGASAPSRLPEVWAGLHASTWSRRLSDLRARCTAVEPSLHRRLAGSPRRVTAAERELVRTVAFLADGALTGPGWHALLPLVWTHVVLGPGDLLAMPPRGRALVLDGAWVEVVADVTHPVADDAPRRLGTVARGPLDVAHEPLSGLTVTVGRSPVSVSVSVPCGQATCTGHATRQLKWSHSSTSGALAPMA